MSGSDENLVILAGGLASRMKKSESREIDSVKAEEANSKTKTMISLGTGSRPFIDYLIMNATETGYQNICIVISEKDNSIRKHFEESENRFPGIKFSFAIQKIPAGRTKPLGTADALYCALNEKKEWRNQRFTVCNSDNLYSIDAFKKLLKSDKSNSMINYDSDGLKLPEEKIKTFAINNIDSEGYLIDIIEKPDETDMAMLFKSQGFIGISMNIWNFSYNEILPALEEVPINQKRDEKELPDAVKLMVRKYNRKIMTYRHSEHVPDLTSKSDIEKVEAFIRSKYGRVDLNERS